MTDRLQWIQRSHLFLIGAVCGLSHISGWLSARDVAAGGTVMALNFWSLRVIGGWFVKGGKGRAWGAARLTAACLLKVSALLGVTAVFLSGVRWNYHPVSLLAGVSLLMMAIVASLFVRRFDNDGTSV